MTGFNLPPGVSTNDIPGNNDPIGEWLAFSRRSKEPVSVIESDRLSPDEVLADAAATFRERNAVYGSNYRMVAPLVRTLFPNGVPQHLVTTDHWHLFELILVKLSRFAISELKHVDSIHDAMVYAAMVESIIREPS